MIYIGIVGSRDRSELQKIEEILSWHGNEHGYNNITVISGGADGIDTEAKRMAQKYGFQLIEYKPKFKEYPKKGNNIYFERNKKIAKKSDYLYAFPKDRRGGTMNTVKYFKEFGKEDKLIIID